MGGYYASGEGHRLVPNPGGFLRRAEKKGEKHGGYHLDGAWAPGYLWLIFLAQVIVWTWEAKERNRKRKTLPEPRRKGREDYWAV